MRKHIDIKAELKNKQKLRLWGKQPERARVLALLVRLIFKSSMKPNCGHHVAFFLKDIHCTAPGGCEHNRGELYSFKVTAGDYLVKYLIFKEIYFLCVMRVLLACSHVHHMCAWCPGGQRGIHGFPGFGITEGCNVPYGSYEPN